MRTNLKDSVKPDMMQPGTRAKIIARNTFQFTAPNGDRVTRLHQTDVVRVTPNGKIVLNSGGWRTVTTKDRMNTAHGVRLYSSKGSWYVTDGNGAAVPYYDGITLPDCFAPKAKAKAERTEQAEQKLRAAIRKFSNKLDKLECLPEPSPGDCWLCCMRTDKGETMGQLGGASSDAEHLRQHIKEGYLHGSLIMNALKHAGYNDPAFIFHYEQSRRKAGEKLHNGGDVKRALRRYLFRNLGLVA